MSALAPTQTKTERETATATWYVQKGSNDTWFRCDAPAEAVGGKVAYVSDRLMDRATMFPNRDTALPWSVEFTRADGAVEVASTKRAFQALSRSRLAYVNVDVVFPEHEGSAVFTRPCGRRAILAQSMREQGILTLAETDDNYMADRWWNLHQRQVGWDEQAKEVVCRAMCSMDRNVFSTSWLRDRYWDEYKKRLGKQGLPEMFVCRNHVPRADWPERDEGTGKVRVGFMGSGSHVWDVQKIYAAIHAAHEYGGAETVMIGYSPAKPDNEPDELEINGETFQMRSEKSKAFRDGWAKVVDTHIPWIDPGEYRRAPLPLDIGLAPLARADDFTMGKSDSKALEYTISGAACVLSNSGIYNTAGWKHEVNCLMGNSTDEMAVQTLRLIRDPKLRYELVTAAQEYVANERNEDVMREEWSAALT
jgi:hypothetical protein